MPYEKFFAFLIYGLVLENKKEILIRMKNYNLFRAVYLSNTKGKGVFMKWIYLIIYLILIYYIYI